MDKKICILNGPPGSGKDTVANYLHEQDPSVQRVKFAYPLERLYQSVAHALLKDQEALDAIYEPFKDKATFFGRTKREVKIALSEDLVKPLFGKDFFGKRVVENLKRDPHERFIFSDGGFMEEFEPVREAVGSENILLVRLKRPGHDFSKDSRGYLYPEGISTIDFLNDPDPSMRVVGGNLIGLRQEILGWFYRGST